MLPLGMALLLIGALIASLVIAEFSFERRERAQPLTIQSLDPLSADDEEAA